MTAFDVVAILIVAVSALIGFARGAVREVVTLVAFGAAAVMALLALPFTTPVMRALVHKPPWAGAAAAVLVVFVLVYVLLRVFGGQLARFLHASNLGGPDRALGAGVGVARALVALGGFFLLYDKAMPRDLSPGWITGGATWPVARASGHALEKLAPQGGRLSDGVGRLMRDNVKSGFGGPGPAAHDEDEGAQLGGDDAAASSEAAPTPRRIPSRADSDDKRQATQTRGLQVRLTDDRHSAHPRPRASGDEVLAMNVVSEAADHWVRDPDDDTPRLECGVFGVWNMEDASAVVALGLHALQHRGQEACGMASFDGQRFATERHMGHVGEAFGKGDLTLRLPGYAAIGHTRYATAGGHAIRNVQPMFADLDGGGIAIAHNGNLTNFLTLRRQLVSEGSIFQSTSDSEVILHLVARSRKTRVVDRFINALHEIEGGYALVALTNTRLIGARDPLGIRPLVLGAIETASLPGVAKPVLKYVLASETCALEMVGARFVRDVEPGEVVVISDSGVESLQPFPAARARPCLFEYVYFSRPDSVVNGKSVYDVRKRMGARLAQETGVEADVVVPVPDSGVPAALGYAQGSGIPYELGIIRGHYVGRTFIQPTQGVRELGVRMKHSPNRAVLEGKRVVLIDDSIVRGTTSVKIVRMVREAGAREVHLRSASPPIKWPDFYGIDMPDREKLIAAQKSLAEMQEMLEVDSLGFLSVEGLYWAMGAGARDDARPQYTDHYFTGDYPTRLTDREIAEGRNAPVERQLSFLVEA